MASGRIVCCCGKPLDGSHDHYTCGPPIDLDEEDEYHRQKEARPWFVDCYHVGAILGDQFPVNSYGPASFSECEELIKRIEHNFNWTELTTQTKGQNPLPRDYWPGVERPR